MPNFATKAFFTDINSTELDAACRAQRMRFEEDFKKADVYIVRDTTTTAVHVLWAAVLAGRFVCDPLYIISHGARGCSLKFKAATAIARAMHFTPRFAVEHEDLCLGLIWHSTTFSQQTSKWKLVEDEASFMDAANAANARGKPTQVVVFCVEEEMPRFAHVKLCYTARTGLDALASFDRGLSATGLAGHDARWRA